MLPEKDALAYFSTVKVQLSNTKDIAENTQQCKQHPFFVYCSYVCLHCCVFSAISSQLLC